jgi:hypothetical protein
LTGSDEILVNINDEYIIIEKGEWLWQQNINCLTLATR